MNEQEKRIMLAVAGLWAGYKEKAYINYAAYESKDDNVGRANYTRFGRIADLVTYGEDVRRKDGYAWCAMFVISCIYESFAGQQDCRLNHLTINHEARKRTIDAICGSVGVMQYMAGVDNILKCFARRRKVVEYPLPGDLVVYTSGSRGYHIGIVEECSTVGFTSIEGNTKAEGDEIVANGGEVARKTRKITKNTIFLRL